MAPGPEDSGPATGSIRRRAKIVCTLGPATQDRASMSGLVAAGMDVARINLSHGGHESHRRQLDALRVACEELGRPVAVLADLQGPKIRLGRFEGGRSHWAAGDQVVITTEDVPGDSRRVSSTYPGLVDDVEPGNSILVDDGNLALRVVSVAPTAVTCLVLAGGPVSDHKGLSVPGARLSLPPLTPKDVEDIRFATEMRVDMVALSFVRHPSDVHLVRRTLLSGGSRAGVIAKIERPEAVRQIADIIDAFDGVMVARGDLAVETCLERVPLIQKEVIRLARERGKPAIVATQMLESMIEHTRPTRAEVTDVATAVYDGADALMLSGETSVGRDPGNVVETMARIVAVTEEETAGRATRVNVPTGIRSSALAAAAIDVARTVEATALVAFTQTGATARRLARHRPTTPILALTPDPVVGRQLALSWGIESCVLPAATTSNEIITQVNQAAYGWGRVKRGECVVIVSGSPPGRSGSTNTIKVHYLD